MLAQKPEVFCYILFVPQDQDNETISDGKCKYWSCHEFPYRGNKIDLYSYPQETKKLKNICLPNICFTDIYSSLFTYLINMLFVEHLRLHQSLLENCIKFPNSFINLQIMGI